MLDFHWTELDDNLNLGAKMRNLEAERRHAQLWLSAQRELGRAPVIRNAPRGDVIHDVTIEGQRFSACIFRNNIFVGKHGSWSCALGVASINDDSLDGPGWGICKYWNQRHVDLHLSESGRRTLALEFGLPIVPEIGYENMYVLIERDFFFASPVFQSLVAWAAAHPRKIRRLIGDSYLGLWPMSALTGHQVEATPGNVMYAKEGYRDDPKRPQTELPPAG